MWKTKRQLLKSLALGSTALLASRSPFLKAAHLPAGSFSMPDEGDPHLRTWMAFVANPTIWTKKQIAQVKHDLALIAKTIAKYEPVSVLTAKQDMKEASQRLHAPKSNYPITLHEFSVDDLWLRDTGPTFAYDHAHRRAALDFNFNGWGGKQTHALDAKVAEFIAEQAGSRRIISELTLEGGCFEVDGEGTAIMTKSCIINNNRNPGWQQGDIEDELKALLGLKKIIWLNGIKGRDITDGHTDFYARFIAPGKVAVSRDNYEGSYDYKVTRENIRALNQNTDALGRRLELTIIDAPDSINEAFGIRDFAAGYIGYYLCNGGLIMQKFGDEKTDAKAKRQLQKAFPDRVIEQIAIDGIASGGGSIHCATQQEIVAYQAPLDTEQTG